MSRRDRLESSDGADGVDRSAGSNAASRFDRWAETYDRAVLASEQFPLLGYRQTLTTVFRAAHVNPGMVVLDLGTGTGNLARLFLEAGCEVWGTDFSQAMLNKACQKLPHLHTRPADLLDPLPSGFPDRYDRIVSSYAFHHLAVGEKLALVRDLARDRLAQGGWIVIGDVAFERAGDRDDARERFADLWDAEEDYWAADEFTERLDAGLQWTYEQVAFCAGVYTIRPA